MNGQHLQPSQLIPSVRQMQKYNEAGAVELLHRPLPIPDPISEKPFKDKFAFAPPHTEFTVIQADVSPFR